MVDRDELSAEIRDVFADADYPVESPLDLVPALADGPATTIEAGEFRITAMELNATLGGGDFPYESLDAFVTDVVDELDERDLV